MPQRNTTPLTNAERTRRYRAKHPEYREKHRLNMQKLRAEKRLEAGHPRLRVIVLDPDTLDAGLLDLILALIERKQIIAVIS